MTKSEALAKYLGLEVSEVESAHDDNTFEADGSEYMVLTDGESDEMTAEMIRESVWAFNASFLAAHARDGIDQEVIELIQSNDRCEGNNRALTALIKDVEHFIDDAIRADGRGHFLNTYDGEENEQEWKDAKGNLHHYFIYRMN